MAKNSITDYSKTAASNTDIQSVDIAEGCLPSGINNAIREIMADLADVNDGTVTLTSPSFAAATITGDLTVDTNTLHVDSTNNRVGINDATPSEELDINGDGSDVRIRMYDGAGASVGRIEHSGANFDISNTATSTATMTFTTGSGSGAERMRIDSSGNVGIGTSSPSNKLHVDGHIKYNGRLLPASTAADGTAGAPAIPVGYDYNTGFFRPTADTIGFSTNATERMRIDNSGNVGIGGTTTTGWANKQVVLDAGSNTSAAFVMVNDTTGRAGTDGSVITLSGSDMYLIQRESANMIFRTANTERMRIDSSGRVGIGTSSPSAPLEVNVSGASDALILTRDTGTNGELQIDFNGANANFNSEQGGFAFETSAASNAMTITSAGLVGIGDSNPLSILHVGSGLDANVPITLAPSTGGNVEFRNTSGTGTFTFTNANGSSERLRIDGSSPSVAIGKTTFGTSGQGIVLNGTPSAPQQYFNKSQSGAINGVLFYHSNSYVGGINYNNTSTSFATSSDYRLKENVTDITDGIERVKQLNPSRFNFIADADRTVDGFIAHEAATVVPEAVTGEKDAVDGDGNPEYQGIDQAKLVPLLTAALQEAITKIEDLETRIATLEGN